MAQNKPIEIAHAHASSDNSRAVWSKGKLQATGKLFGFRSGSPIKIIVALAYYALAWLYLGASIYRETVLFEFEGFDPFIIGIKYVFFFVILFSPALFLSNFNYSGYIPLFNSNKVLIKACGFVIVWAFCNLSMMICVFNTSGTYKDSVRNYDTKIEKTKKNKEEVKNKNKTTGFIINLNGFEYHIF